MSRAQTALSDALPTSQQIYIRSLTADDSADYRALRQKILHLGDGRNFSDSYMREKQLKTERAWREWCTERPDHCILGTFDNGQLIGIMMITHYDGFGDRTVEWEAVWLDPRYRRLGIAKQAYQRAQQWTEDQGYERVAGFIRTDNSRATEIFQRLGGQYISTKRNEVWADGSIADVHTFLLDLRKPALNTRQENTVRHPAKALQALNTSTTDEPRSEPGHPTIFTGAPISGAAVPSEASQLGFVRSDPGAV